MKASQRAFVCAWILLAALFAQACSNPAASKAKHLEKGKQLAAAQQYQSAVLEFRNALKIDPLYGEARFALGEALSHLVSLPDAAPELAVEMLRQYVAAAELLPKNFEAQLKAAGLLLAAGEFESAKKHSTAAIKLNPKDIDAQTIFAMSLAGIKDLNGALKGMREAAQLEPSNFRAFVNLGTLEATAGHTAEAEAAFKQAVALSPKAAPANTALGYFYWSHNRLDEAEKALQIAATSTPYDGVANQYLAMFYLIQNRLADAEVPLVRMSEQKDSDATLMLADLYVSQHRLEKARPLYSLLASQRRTRGAATRRLAVLDYESGKTKEAHAAVDAVLKEQPNNVDLLTQNAAWAVKEGKLDAALEFATNAAKAGPDSALAHYTLGLVRQARRENAEAANAFRETLRLNPQLADAHLQLSRLSLAEGDSKDALAYAEAARKQKRTVETQAGVVRALLAKGDLNRADTELTALASEFPNSPALHTLRGQLLSARSDTAGAAREFDRALAANPADLAALTGLLGLDVKQKHVTEGRARLSKAVAAQPSSSPLLVLAANFENTVGDAAAAEKYLRQSITVDPSNMAAYGMLGRIYFAQHRLDEAKVEYERLAARRPDDLGAKTMIGMILDIQQKPDEAIKIYQDIVKGSDRAAVASNNLAYHYASRNENLQVALQLAQAAKRELPDSHEVDDTLGFVYYKQNLYDQAIDAFERCVEKDPKNAMYQYHLGLAYAKKGVKDKAKQSLERALSLEPTFAGAADARSVLATLRG